VRPDKIQGKFQILQRPVPNAFPSLSVIAYDLLITASIFPTENSGTLGHRGYSDSYLSFYIILDQLIIRRLGH
jgi:hypothetical protein